MKTKRAWIIGIGVVVVAGVAMLGQAVWQDDPPAPDGENHEQIVEYVASEKFTKLDNSKKLDYISKAGWEVFRNNASELSEEQRNQLRRNVGQAMRERMTAAVDKYFELPADEREAYLDEAIDRMGNRGRGGMGRPRGQGDRQAGRPRGSRRGFTPDRLKRMIERTSPERRAKFVEFMQAMRQRRSDRGMSTGRGPH